MGWTERMVERMERVVDAPLNEVPRGRLRMLAASEFPTLSAREIGDLVDSIHSGEVSARPEADPPKPASNPAEISTPVARPWSPKAAREWLREALTAKPDLSEDDAVHAFRKMFSYKGKLTSFRVTYWYPLRGELGIGKAGAIARKRERSQLEGYGEAELIASRLKGVPVETPPAAEPDEPETFVPRKWNDPVEIEPPVGVRMVTLQELDELAEAHAEKLPIVPIPEGSVRIVRRGVNLDAVTEPDGLWAVTLRIADATAAEMNHVMALIEERVFG